ncbi:MAG: GAF domain-containing protein [Gammaproteobacteria bacterium]|nr:GAF domain-containing protein [Gammaproteobacteria bacterium]
MATSEHEERRLRVLEIYDRLDTTSDESLDNLTRLAAHVCGTEIALVTLVDHERQHFKSRYGIDGAGTPREHSFCQFALAGSDPLVVEDAQEDERFADNPLVIGDPYIRFYAGAPLRIEGDYALGTLCVIDSSPGTLSPFKLEALEILRDCVVTQLKFQKARRDMAQLQEVMPFCAWCNRIRVTKENGEQQWRQPAEFVQEREPVSHGICPSCAELVRSS